MIYSVICKRAILITAGLISLISTHSMAAPAPSEQTKVKIQRSSTSANPVVTSLTKNLFKTESFDAEYTVQVPYQVEETYTHEVPYQTTESYIENVPYSVDVPYTTYETDYRQEYRCEEVTKYRNECRNEQKCYIVPGDGPNCRHVEECGTNAQGERICKTREVCDGGSGPQQRCENQQTCENVPYTDRDCRYENVPYQREVTRYRTETHYRQETKTRTVTKYRAEIETRTVTKYRSETRCCKTQTREVFDRQLQFQVTVAFPQDAVIAGNETETVHLELISAAPALVGVKVISSGYTYVVHKQQVNGASISVELKIGAQYNQSNAGVSSITDLKLKKEDDDYQVVFRDSVKSTKVNSKHVIVITDQTTGAVIREIPALTPLSSGLSVTALAAADIPKNIKTVATLLVRREGPTVENEALEFKIEIARN